MKAAITATLITIFLILVLAATFLGFITGYSSDAVAIRDYIGDGVLFLSALITTGIVIQIFVVWTFLNQVDKLKKHLDSSNKRIASVEASVRNLNDSIDLLL